MPPDIKPPLGNLPAEPNSFVGGDRDREGLAFRLSDVRSLAPLALDTIPDFADGAWLVELADNADPALVRGRVAAALGIREETGRPLAETLLAALRPRPLPLLPATSAHRSGEH